LLLRTTIPLSVTCPRLMNIAPPMAAPPPAPPAPDELPLLDPPSAPRARPSATVRSDRRTVTFAAGGPAVAPGTPGLTNRTRVASLPLIVNASTPGPSIVRLLSITSWLASVIVPRAPEANATVSPGAAFPIAARSDPGPLSAVEVTVIVPPDAS
jgi:hypothetical protein